MTARFRLALWALTLTLALGANAVQAKTPLVSRATCLATCGDMITGQCTKTLKNGTTNIPGSLVVDPAALAGIGWTPPLASETGLANLMQTP